MSDDKRNLGVFAFMIGGLSFLPVVGVVFALIAIAWGTFTRKAGGRTLAQIATAGATFAAATTVAVYYVALVQRGDVYDRLRVTVAQARLNAMVAEIELYKAEYGEYPASLEEMHQGMREGVDVSEHDPTDLKPRMLQRPFYYVRVGPAHYILRSVGFDGLPFTGEDVVPQIDPGAFPRCGLLLNPPAQPLVGSGQHL
jgi:hypothetical protein